MSLEQILVGILALLIGAAFCFSGIKWFMVLLPIWGFLVGFTFGANAIFYIAGADHGFFADALAIVSGLVVGVLFAVLSYLYYYFAVILLGGAIGYALGVGVMDFFNLSGAEILTFIVGVVVGGIFAFGFIILAMPAVLAIWGTALGGAVTMVTGLLLVLDRVKLDTLNSGMAGAIVNETSMPWLWIIVTIALTIAGAWIQINKLGAMSEAIEKTSYKNPGMTSTAA